MVGAHQTRTLGGISAVINELLASSLATEFGFRHIASQIDEYRRVGKFWLALTSLLRFAGALVWWRPHLVYVHVGSNASLYRKAVFITLARCYGQKVLTHFHAGDFDHYYHQQSRVGQWLIRSGLRQSHKIIAVSKASARRLRELLPTTQISLIPNGIDTAAFATPVRNSDSFVRVLFVGAMGRLKGERDLLEAMQSVVAHHSQVRLLMLGHGAETVTNLCQQNNLSPFIEQLGPVAHEDRHAFFKAADVFVLPSYGEGMPMAVLEAMAAGLPVIATRVGGIPELITDGVEGFLIEAGDQRALAKCLKLLVSDTPLRQQMGAHSRAKAQKFDKEIMLSQVAREIRQLLGEDQ